MPNTVHTAAPSVASLTLLFLRVASAALSSALTYPFRSTSTRASTFRRHVFFAALRRGLHYITIPQSRYLSPGTQQQYHNYCSTHAQVPHTMHVQSASSRPGNDGKGRGREALGHWIGREDAETVVLYCHGGGYTQPATRGYFEYWHQMVGHCSHVTNLKNEKPALAILLLEYTLAPEACYPSQLLEVSTLLSHLLSTGRHADSIILAGDSAGGNLALGLLSHILHPHRELPIIKFEGKLKGCLLLSPLVTFNTDHDSFTRNAEKDILIPTVLKKWGAMFLGAKLSGDGDERPQNPPVHGDPFSEPSLNGASWWLGLPKVVEDMLLWVGKDEVFVDGIKDFHGALSLGWANGGGAPENEQLVLTAGAAHIEPVMATMVEPGVKGEARTVIEEWLGKVMER
ncbi:alpha/beta-hydrolase [Amniculicola lignicola CBS 123094]|uniref:Alpha/beta-hydrolase n=1 Tax=Amniculicola lignicola CBS 123094 TaxID=1392246 RepID=A0A6A5WI51_9PLEO|nr:alpha/beta-hydrolase [Amniculicola lignicola CBS 123094]